MKTLAMLTGEIDFNNIPIGPSYQRRNGQISYLLGYCLYLAFIFMVVIALMNLLNALAVSDIAKMEADAEIQHQISMISILKEIEDVALSNRKVVEAILNRFSLLRPLIKIFDCLLSKFLS